MPTVHQLSSRLLLTSLSVSVCVGVSCADIQYGYCASFRFLSDVLLLLLLTMPLLLLLLLMFACHFFVGMLMQLNVTRLPLSWAKSRCVSTRAYHYLAGSPACDSSLTSIHTSLFICTASELIKNPDK